MWLDVEYLAMLEEQASDVEIEACADDAEYPSEKDVDDRRGDQQPDALMLAWNPGVAGPDPDASMQPVGADPKVPDSGDGEPPGVHLEPRDGDPEDAGDDDELGDFAYEAFGLEFSLVERRLPLRKRDASLLLKFTLGERALRLELR